MTEAGIFEACLTTSDQGDMTGLLQCVSDKLEVSQSITSNTMSSYLLVLSVSAAVFSGLSRRSFCTLVQEMERCQAVA